MSTSIKHKVFIGFELDFKDICIIDKEAEYRTQKVYCQNTGRELKPKLIEISPAKYHYEFEGKSYDNPYEIFKHHSGIHVNGELYIGEELGEYKDMDYYACNIGKLSEEEVKEKFSKMKEKYPNRNIQLHTLYWVC